MLEIMLPTVFPVQAHVPVQAPVQAQIQAPVAVPVVVNTPPVVDVPLVAAGVQPPVTMEVVEENDNEILKRLFLQRFGRALPEVEVDDVDLNMDLINLTKEDNDDEMEVATSDVVQVVVKTEAPEAPEAAPIDDRRRSSRLGRLRKSEIIPEKEAVNNVIADTDTDMAEDTSVGSVNAVESVNVVESVNTESGKEGKTYEQVMAEIDAAIADN